MLGIKNSLPKDILFIDSDIHTYKFIDEVYICTYWVSDHKLAIELNKKILNLDCLNKRYRDRIQKNLNFSLNKTKQKKIIHRKIKGSEVRKNIDNVIQYINTEINQLQYEMEHAQSMQNDLKQTELTLIDERKSLN